jgi:hypothetical protein
MVMLQLRLLVMQWQLACWVNDGVNWRPVAHIVGASGDSVAGGGCAAGGGIVAFASG